MKKTLFLLLTLFITNFNYAQSILLDSLVQKNGFPFQNDRSISFQGKGWDILLDEIKQSNSVLLGETHFTNEIPYFPATARILSCGPRRLELNFLYLLKR